MSNEPILGTGTGIDEVSLLKTKIMMYSNYYFASPKVCRTKPANQTQHSFRPKMNVQEKENTITIEFALAGVSKEDINVSIKEGILTLDAHRKLSSEEKNYLYREFGSVSFKNSMRLPEDIDADSIQAQFLNGVLQLRLNKIVKPSFQVEIK
jgi:HSP20 family protein